MFVWPFILTCIILQGVPGLDMDLSEDQQMLQAIAMSLGQDMVQPEVTLTVLNTTLVI